MLRDVDDFVLARAWDFADRVFKAISWLLLIGALLAIDSRLPMSELRATALILMLVWIVATSSTIINLAEELLAHILRGSQLIGMWRHLLLLSLTVVTGSLSIGVLIPFAARFALMIIDVASKSVR